PRLPAPGRAGGARPRGGRRRRPSREHRPAAQVRRAACRHRVRALRRGAGPLHLPQRDERRLRGGDAADVRLLRHLERDEAARGAGHGAGLGGGVDARRPLRRRRPRAARPRQEALMRAAAALLLALLSAWAGAARIVIDAAHDPESRLEIRTVTLPGGEEAQVYVLTGRGLTVRIDDDVLVADHVEFDLTRRIVRVVGRGSFTRGEETVEGEDLVIDLSRESLEGSDVLVVTPEIDVSGDSASRVPGMIAIALGEFSPCSRCAQEVEDYGFRAERIELYPGDRLVAHGVTVLIRGQPVLTVPLLALPLGPEDRQPRLLYETGTASSRARLELTWPYVAGPDARGAVTLRYHADVEPGAS